MKNIIVSLVIVALWLLSSSPAVSAQERYLRTFQSKDAALYFLKHPPTLNIYPVMIKRDLYLSNREVVTIKSGKLNLNEAIIFLENRCLAGESMDIIISSNNKAISNGHDLVRAETGKH